MRRFYRIALRCSCFLIFTIPLLLYYRIIKSIPSQPEIVKSHSELLQYYPTFPNLESQLHLNTFDQTDLFYPDDCLKGDPCAVIRPHFIIIGAEKCGTTSMYNYLMHHPQVVPLSNRTLAFGRKEIRYFHHRTKYTGKLSEYLLENFPRLSEVDPLKISRNRKLVAGESTPDYIRVPLTSKRIRDLLPSTKLIALVRNPVDRAYSHYNHALKLDNEFKYTGNNSYETLAKGEQSIIQECLEALQTSWDDFIQCHIGKAMNVAQALHLPFRAKRNGRLVWLLQTLYRGLYAAQLKHWMRDFPASQILVVQSEEFYKEPSSVMTRVSQFLELDPIDWTPFTGAIYNFGKSNKVTEGANEYIAEPMRQETSAWLHDFFDPFNKQMLDVFDENGFPLWSDS